MITVGYGGIKALIIRYHPEERPRTYREQHLHVLLLRSVRVLCQQHRHGVVELRAA
jgi:hypothetical protein